MKIFLVHDDCPLRSDLESQLLQRGYELWRGAPQQFIERLRVGVDDDDDPGDGALGDDAPLVVDCTAVGASDAALAGPGFAAFEQRVALCRERNWPFLMISDSRVFPARSKQRYREIDDPLPASAAGLALLERERLLGASERHVIVRSGPLIAAHGDNLLTGLLRQLRSESPVAGAQDVRFAPTLAADLARVLAAMCDQLACNAQCWGVYHYHSSDPTTGYEFAEVVMAAAAQYWAIAATSIQLQVSIDDPQAGLYPLLNCQRIRDTFGIQQLPWRKAIPQLLKTIHADEPHEAGHTP